MIVKETQATGCGWGIGLDLQLYHLSREVKIEGLVTWPEACCKNSHR